MSRSLGGSQQIGVAVLLIAGSLGGVASTGALAAQGPRLVEPADAIAEDLALIASSHGWTIEEAEARHRSTEAVGRVAHQVAVRSPSKFVGSKVLDDPLKPPRLYIKGATPGWVTELIEREPVPIDVVDHQPYTYDELEERKMRVHESLMAAGYNEVATGINVSGAGIIPVGVRTTPGLPSRPSGVLDFVPAYLRDSVRLTVHDESYFGEDHALGGQKTTYTGDNFYCTSGFSVIGFNGRGVVIADHCRPENRISASNHVMTFRQGHYGAYGDVAWYTTDTTEYAEFYAATDEIRGVLYQERVGELSEGETVCRFGRGSGNRNCSADIADVSQACGNLNRMVLMDKDVSTGGDSGGPWFRGNRAFGSHHGYCGSQSPNDAFTFVARFLQAIDVELLIFE